jgi:hypothetical protein
MTGFDELSPRDKVLAERLHSGLRQREPSLGLTTTVRLRAARARAVGAAGEPARRTSWLYASGGLATAVAIATLLVLRPSQVGPTSMPDSGVHATRAEAFDVLTDDVDAEFYEDLDLYRWLERGRDGAA